MEEHDFENFLKTLDASNIHLSSYNHFILHELPLLIQSFSTTLNTPKTKNQEIKLKLEFFGVHVKRACALRNGVYEKITPFICRRDNLSYMAPVYASVKQTKIIQDRSFEVNFVHDVVITHVPVMLRSCICHTRFSKEERKLESHTDKGGYFIINGVERVLVTQRKKCYNFPQVLKQGDKLTVNMRSMSKETNHSILVEMSCSEKNSISCSIPFTKKPIPLHILVRAFGVSLESFERDLNIKEFSFSSKEAFTEQDALKYIGSLATKTYSTKEKDPDPEPQSFSDDSEDEEEQEEQEDEVESVLETIESIENATQIEYAKQILDTELFPHLGVNATLEMKISTICSMVRALFLTKLKKRLPDNRDNLMFHRFENSGILLYELYGMCFRNFFNTHTECGKDGAVTDFTNTLCVSTTETIRSCMAKGRWGVQKSYIKEGVCQQLTRYSVLSTQSHLHRLSLPVGKEGKNVKIRLLHPSQFGFVCLFETPEGQACGIVLNFTASVIISKDYSASYIRDLIVKYIPEEKESGGPDVDIWIDNTFTLKTKHVKNFVAHFKALREENIIPEQISIYLCQDVDFNTYEIRIFTEKGRVMRPLLTPAGKIAYLDPIEIQNNYVAVSREEVGWTYCELHPVLLMSICAGAIPFSDHMQSPRIVYESSMLKQAIGFFTNTFPIRYDTTCEVLDYAQKCMLSTKIGRAFGMHEAPAGINCIVAIMTQGSWNAEDCIILHKAAVERGLFSSTTYKTITVEEYKVKSNDTRRFCLPPKNIRKEIYNYGLLDDNGIIKKGSRVSRKDVIVGCIQEIIVKGTNSRKEVIEKDCSEICEEEGIVESAEVVNSFSGNRIVKIILKIRKIPEMGDKSANLNAQKGTAGLILSTEDMPFCAEEGIIPDILVNPNALPSRMTISMFLEMVLGQECALDGNLRDATPFEKIEKIGNVLEEYGYEKLGDKVLIDGTTGKPYKTKIFMGTDYYQKLKHMVSNKINSRNFGNVTISTRQPVSGRSKQGGIRAGEMEVQGWLSHGTSDFLREKLFECSDKFSVMICSECGIISNHKDRCHICQRKLSETDLPYAAKIVLQIINMCSIKTTFEIRLK